MLLALLYAFAPFVAAQSSQQPRYVPTFPVQPVANAAAVVGGVNYRFTVLTDGLLRYEWASDGVFEDRASTFAVNRNLSVPQFNVTNGTNLEIVTPRFHLTYNKQQFSNSGFSVQVNGSGTWKFGDATNDLGGTIRTLDTIDGPTGMGHGILSRFGFGVIDDSASMLFTSDQWIAPRRNGTRSDGYIFAYGHDYKAAITAFYAVSGNQPLLPRFALGNMWSRYHKYTDKEYLALLQRFQDDKVPMSVAVIDMDWHLVDVPNYDTWTGYTWNRTDFADPAGFLQNLQGRGLHATLNDHPALGIRPYEDIYSTVAKALGYSQNATVPFDSTNRTFMDAYYDIVHHSLEQISTRFWWLDWQQGDTSKIPGIDPLWVLNHYTFLQNRQNRQRPFVLSRFGGPGAHRYQAGFSGDVVITWGSLNFQPQFTITASNIGYGWWSHDIGGHMHGIKSDELMARWTTWGCFSPILRLHGENNPFVSHEPWLFNPETYSVMEDVMRFRARLVPYLYTMNYRAASTGLPLLQGMYWDYPDQDSAYSVPNQYLFGSDLIVAPVTSPRDLSTHLASVNAWLPPGRFVDIFTNTVYDGNRNLTLYRHLYEYPVLARQGSIIPLDGCLVPPNGAQNPSSIEILLAVGQDGKFELVEDDGTGSTLYSNSAASASETIQVSKTPITYTQSTGVLTIGPTSGEKSWSVRLVGYTPKGKPTVNISKKGHPGRRSLPNGCDTPLRSVFPTALSPVGTSIAIGTIAAGGTATVNLNEANPQLSNTPVSSTSGRLYSLLWEAEMAYPPKPDIWNSITTSSDKVGAVNSLVKQGTITANLGGAFIEVVSATSGL